MNQNRQPDRSYEYRDGNFVIVNQRKRPNKEPKRRKRKRMPSELEKQKIIYAWIDGSAIPNPGHGGWGAVLMAKNRVKEFGGYMQKPTTNNEAEFRALIGALEQITETHWSVIVETDCKLLVDAYNGKSRLTQPLLIQFLGKAKKIALEKNLIVNLRWVKGHSGHVFNDLAHRLATKNADWKKGLSH